MIDPDHIQRWNLLVHQVEETAQRCIRDPEEAQRQGIGPIRDELEHQEIGLPSRRREPYGYSDWLRGAAAKLINPVWDYEIRSAIGGKAVLILRGLRDGSDADPPSL